MPLHPPRIHSQVFRKRPSYSPLPLHAEKVCPECAAPLARASGCVSCPQCGWGRCG